MGLKGKVFTLKTHGADLYKWAPLPFNKQVNRGSRPYYCTASAGSQGEDWISTYCYIITVIAGQQGKSAYVACDYVE